MLLYCLNMFRIYNSSVPRVLKSVISLRFSHESASEQHNIKKFKLIKRLASTILFGGTFLTVLWSRKRNRSSLFNDAKLVPNDNFQKKFMLYEFNGYVFPSFVMNNMEKVRQFVFKDEDILVLSFPKAGTTWLQEIIFCILNGVSESSTSSLEDRFPYLEFIYPGISSIQKIEGQRLIKSHLPYSVLPKDILTKNTKIFYIMRNPKDVAVSYYHFVRMMTISSYSGNFIEFFQDFTSNKVPYGPVWKHYQEAWEIRDNPNVFIVFYEDLHKDLYGNIKKIAAFLNKDITEKEIHKIMNHCSFSNMSRNPSVNYQHWDDLGIRKRDEAKFMRKGEVGDWQNYFNSDMNNSIDIWITEKFKDIASSFTYGKIEE